MSALTFAAVLLIGQARPAPDTKQAGEDVTLILTWLRGGDTGGVFTDQFLDRRIIAARKDMVFYTDVSGVTLPKDFRAVPYDHYLARYKAIQGGHRESPAVLITRSTAEELPEPGVARKKRGQEEEGAPKGQRFYYVEVAIGNLATHWMRIVVEEKDGKRTARCISAAVS